MFLTRFVKCGRGAGNVIQATKGNPGTSGTSEVFGKRVPKIGERRPEIRERRPEIGERRPEMRERRPEMRRMSPNIPQVP
jgi:hypothetical protein